MTTSLPQQNTIVQYGPVDGMTSTFIYPFLILSATDFANDLAVYVTPAGQAPNPAMDIQILNTAYTVTGTGYINGGTIIFNTDYIPTTGAIVTLSRNMSVAIDTQFSDAKNFNGQTLDDAFERVVLIMQQLSSDYQFRALSYLINSYIPDSQLASTTLPVLTGANNQIWISQNGQIVAATLEENPDVSTLRSELASEIQNADGASLIGYYNTSSISPGAYVLSDFLNNLPAYISAAAPSISSGFQTGDLKWSDNPTPLSSWIIYTDGTIGSTASGATVLRDPTAQDLYVMYWNNYTDDICPVIGGRSGTAINDFNSNKPLTLPIRNSSTTINQAGGTYTPGVNVGTPTVTLDVTQMPSHTHTASSSGSFNYYNQNAGAGRLSSNTNGVNILSTQAINITTINSATGGGGPHNNMQPSTSTYLHIKL